MNIYCISIENDEQLKRRGKIPGYDLIGATHHHAYGVATYARSTIDHAQLCKTSDNNNVHEVVVRVGDINISNMYKPPANLWTPDDLGTLPHPAVYVGDYNSHHTLWKYRDTDKNGEILMSWTDSNNTYLVFDAKQRVSFKSAAWNQEYNPDLCFVSTNADNTPMQATRRVLTDFPHSQHSHIIEVGISIPLITSFPLPRWNFKKANWESYCDRLDKYIGWIPPIIENYERFTAAIIKLQKRLYLEDIDRNIYRDGTMTVRKSTSHSLRAETEKLLMNYYTA